MAGKITNEAVKLTYTCPACPPAGLSVDGYYVFGKDDEGFYYKTLDDKYYADLWFIEMLFTPVKKTWVEVEKLFN